MRQFFQRSFSPFSFILIFLLTIEILLLFSVNKKNIGNLDLVIADLRGQAESLQKDVENLAKENIALKHDNLRKQLDSYNQIVGKYEAVKDKSKLSKTPVTDTANSSDCFSNCPAKSLISYVKANGASSGMNGTYFCPPDYASCAGKVNSFDFPVYSSRLRKWLNEDNLFWSNR